MCFSRTRGLVTYRSVHWPLFVRVGALVPALLVLAAALSPWPWIRLDAVTGVMLLLVGSIGLVIVRYSRTYLHGDPGLSRYWFWLLLTLSAVATLVASNHLLVMVLAWTATSLALHQLLTFFPNRTAAIVAAHKKFLVSRLAEVCLAGCLGLVYASVGSFDLDVIARWVSTQPDLTPAMHAAAVLVVLAVALKSAQLPFHGWLMQVMEAPTPVSALLHAGVVNIGGFVLIRLAPWIARADVAMLLLVIIGLTSTIVAALVMTTRVSVKVSLAWSTCAQMGFMLVECGLGLWPLALLHLVAHSLYKAHAFLSAGTAVEAWRMQIAARPAPVISAARFGLAVLAVVALAGLAVLVVRDAGGVDPDDPSVWIIALLASLAVVPLLTRWSRFSGVVRAGGVVALYLGWHVAAGEMIAVPAAAVHPAAWILVAAGLGGLFVVKTILERRPEGGLARALYPSLFAGLYLDEGFTRIAFRIWAPRLGPPAPRAVHRRPEPVEVQS